MRRVWIFLLVLNGCLCCSAQTIAFGAPLGKLAVGYRVEWTTDLTRSWQIPDASGHLQPSARIVRVHTWYPAVPGTGEAITFRDYLQPPLPPGVPPQVAATILGHDLGTPTYSFRGVYGGDEALSDRAMKTQVAARSWADPAPGKYPVVVYSVGQNDFMQDAVALAEFLASNGFIVTTVPHLGTSPRRALLFVHDPLSYETQLRDLELALGKALKLKIADDQRILAAGHSYGGIYALLLAMSSDAVRGVIGLDPTYIAQRAGYEYDLRKFPYFNSDLRIPIVTLRRGSGSLNRSLLDSFTRAERLEIVYPDLMHGDFATVPFLERDLPQKLLREDETKVRSPQAAAEGAANVFRQVLASAQAILSAQPLESSVVGDQSTKHTSTYTAAISAPTNEELYWIYKSRGLPAAEEGVAAARTASPGVEPFEEARMITIANELGYSDKQQESLDIFRLTAFAFPNSPSAQLAAADALVDAGLKDEAHTILLTVLRLDPASQAAKDLLKKMGF